MSCCTEFCTSISSLSHASDATPSHAELLEHLPSTPDTHEWQLGTWNDLQLRSRCELCKLVVAAISESVRDESITPDQPINILLFPDEASFRLSFPSPLHARLLFVANSTHEAQTPDTARLLRQESVGLAKVQGWLQKCDQSHTSCSWRNNIKEPVARTAARDDGDNHNSISNRLSFSHFKKSFDEHATSNFRAIDLELGCVKHVPLDVQYVALSYVWGQTPMIQLRKNNFETLSKERGIDEIRSQLPQTIVDAMDLLRALEIRYLWVDGLCLIQDDKDDVKRGINMMNSIYHGSYFTIVAASGKDASAGLHGFRQDSARSERQQIIAHIAPGIRMTVVHSIDWQLSQSIYSRRGWTLQELVLPDRTLIFINGQAYFRCVEANWSEETWADKWLHWLDADDSNISRIPDPVEGFLPSCWSYQKLCEDFSRRQLRNDEDALRAFAGITRPMAAGMETDLVEGLPGYYLDHFLLFISNTGDMRRRPQFASFSWAGWDGAKMWPRENFERPVVTATGTVDSERRTENILLYLQYNHLVEWESVGLDSCASQLTDYGFGTPSPILNIMRKYPDIFPSLDEDPVTTFRRTALSRFGGSSSSGSIPRWESRSYEWGDEPRFDPGDRVHKTKPLPEFSMQALDLANSQAEFDRLINRMSSPYVRLTMGNWMAVRQIRQQRRIVKKTTQDTTSHALNEQESKDLKSPDSQERETTPIPQTTNLDRRPEAWARHLTRFTKTPDEDPSIPYVLPSLNRNKTPTIPTFPPHSILSFTTISLHLTLGPISSPQPTTPFHRIPGIPLLGKSGSTVGSLHADNISLLPQPGSAVEVLLVARCWKTVGGSALGGEKAGEEAVRIGKGGEIEMGEGLFWVLCVEWEGGIARRRGLGQVVERGLEDAWGVGVKSVLLG